MLTRMTKRPRNLNAWRAAGLLYGDLGTSKAYVIGIAFAVAGYASFWLIAAISILSILIGINYMIVCKYYPNGGGVYASVRNRSEILSLLGAFFLIADYVVTASISALSAFHYLGVPDPTLFAIAGIILIGILNIWGPRHVGSLATILALGALGSLLILAFFSIPHLKEGFANIQPLGKGTWGNWTNFVTVILTLSGIETIANMTGVMQLDPGSDVKHPRVQITSRRAILMVIFEIAFFTTFFSFALSSVNGLTVQNGDVFSGPDNIRDFVLRFLGTSFVGDVLGAKAGLYFGYLLSFIFGLLLLSAVNTAVNGLISLLYLMSQDGELPRSFKKLNHYGVPIAPHIIATLFPVMLLLLVHNLINLAALYAIGFVGAIAMNLGSASTDSSLPLLKKERFILFCSFLIMAAAEVTLFIDKPQARTYVLSIAVIGLVLRGLTREYKKKKGEGARRKKKVPVPLGEKGILCVVHQAGKAFEFSLERAQEENRPLYILFVHEQKVVSERDFERTGEEDNKASKLFALIEKKNKGRVKLEYYYSVSDSPSTTIIEYAKRLAVRRVVMDFPRQGAIKQVLHGEIIREIRPLLAEQIEFIVIPS